MVVRQESAPGRERVAKAHVCLSCFEGVQERVENVESVSFQEFKETAES